MTSIRGVEHKDFEDIVQLNESEVQYTSPMDKLKLRQLDACSRFHWVFIVNDQVAAFLLVMDDRSDYENMNLNWFKNRFSNFLYVDRIVVSKAFAGQKIGSQLYEHLISTANSHHYSSIVCEYNIQPMNSVSKAFHDRFGFEEVGTLDHQDRAKTVSMQRLVLNN
jgi:predicted GNAT superfamily acetyltransferase